MTCSSPAIGKPPLRRVVQLFKTPDQPAVESEIEAAEGAMEILETTAEHPFWVGSGPRRRTSRLTSIRTQLEKEGLLVACYGASRTVFPSPMSLSMGCGEKAYKLEKGRQAKTRDLVPIFETGADVEPVSVTEQEEYYREWLESLRESRPPLEKERHAGAARSFVPVNVAILNDLEVVKRISGI